MIKTSCPVCESKELYDFYKNKVPTLQNRVYSTIQEAKNCNQGLITLTFCDNCKFVFNSSFDEELLVYDSNYNNNVPSKIFNEYYHKIAHYLYIKYELKNKVVYDIGCGKGVFLKLLCTLYPDIHGVGIDPSYEGELDFAKNITFIKDIFKTEQVKHEPGLLICRHVLEHMEQPKKFVSSIFHAFQNFQNVPFFIEVPDFSWILVNETYWDICYEHTNYFSDLPLLELFESTNGICTSIQRAFSDQYLWVEGIIQTNEKNNTAFEKPNIVEKHNVNKFQLSFETNLTNNINRIKEKKASGSKVVLWGMATKGVIYSLSIGSRQELIDYFIDINTDKQNLFTPVISKKIEAPEVLISHSDEHLSVIVMNMNYVLEVEHWLSNNVQRYTIYDALLNPYLID